MKEFNKLFNAFTILTIIIMLITTAFAAGVTIVNKGRSNLHSVNATRNEFVISEYCINPFLN